MDSGIFMEITHFSKGRNVVHLKNNMVRVEICALWKMAIDPSTQSTYFYNMKSREVQWDPCTTVVSPELPVE